MHSNTSSFIFEMPESTAFFFPQKNSHLSYCHILGIASYKAADNSFISVLV